MLTRASFAAALAACAVLLASSANAWGLTGKTSEPPQDSHILPTSSIGSEQVQDHYWWNVKTGAVQWNDPSPVHRTEDGKEYYVDPKTGESTWTKPAELSWVQAQSEDHGREYYHNTMTQESVWDKPDPLWWKKVPVSGPVSTEL